MTRLLYDLAAADPDCRFSQHCWRVRLALAHKGLAFDTQPWRFTEKEAIAFAGTDKVPVLVDGERVVHDSWAILEYLEDTYTDSPSLFGCPDARREAVFLRAWCDGLQGRIAPMIVRAIHDRLHPDDQAYFRRTREQRFGATLEALEGEREQRLPAVRSELAPLRTTLEHQLFIGGDAPLVPDLLVYAAFLWVRHGSDLELLADDDPVADWCARMDERFRGA